MLGAEARSTNVLLNKPMVMRSSLYGRFKPPGRTITTVHERRVPAPDSPARSGLRRVPRRCRRSIAMW
jgi:hypothetical protein